jgi:hypothetical protein
VQAALRLTVRDRCLEVDVKSSKILAIASLLLLVGCGYPFGEPWECDKFVNGCIIR